MTPELTRRLHAEATRQHGLLTHQQARMAGASPAAIEQQLTTGRWLAVCQGVYRVAGAPVTWESQLAAVCLAGGPGHALASHRSAAVLWGIGDIRPGPAEVTIPRGRSLRRTGARVHESRDLHVADPRRRRGIPVTGVERTLIDLGMVCALDRVEDAVFDALDQRLTSWDNLLDRFARHARRGRAGVGSMRSVIDRNLSQALPQGRLEALVDRALRKAGITDLVRQHEIFDRHGFIARVDFADPVRKIAIEADGRSVHARRKAFDRDPHRRNRLVVAGWTVIVVTWEMVVRDPEGIARTVAAARIAASSELPVLRPVEPG